MHYITEYNLSAGGAKHRPLNNLDPILASIRQMASENPVVMFSTSTCCMCVAVKRLFCGMGVNATVYNLDLDPAGDEIVKELTQLQIGGASVLPVVFIGGKLVGSVERVMAAHISGSLVPLLKEAGAIWL